MTIGHADLLGSITERLRTRSLARSSPSPREAPDCSIFLLTGLDELLCSRVIAWLLDPSGTHAQGARFLHAFCHHFRVPPPPCDDVQVLIEAPTNLIERDRRRIDILVHCEGWAMGIENKPRALFQRDQLSDYLEQLERSCSGISSLVVLKGWEGELPAEQVNERVDAAIRSERLINADYGGVQTWLEACVGASESEYVRSLAKDLRRSLRQWLTGGGSVEHQNTVIEGILDDPDQRVAALELIGASDRLLAGLGDRFIADLRTELTGTLFVLSCPVPGRRVELLKKHFVDIDIAPGTPFKMSFGFDMGMLRYPYFGLRPRDEESGRRLPFTRLRKALLDAGFGSSNDYLEWWFWWNYAKPTDLGVDSGDTLGVWRAMGDGSLARGLANTVQSLRQSLEAVHALDWQGFANKSR